MNLLYFVIALNIKQCSAKDDNKFLENEVITLLFQRSFILMFVP